MWDPPRPGLEPMFPTLAGGFLTTAPPGKSWRHFLRVMFKVLLSRIKSNPADLTENSVQHVRTYYTGLGSTAHNSSEKWGKTAWCPGRQEWVRRLVQGDSGEPGAELATQASFSLSGWKDVEELKVLCDSNGEAISKRMCRCSIAAQMDNGS